MGIAEAAVRTTKYGLVPDGDGWFVLNARETRWRDYGPLGAACDFEGKRPFKQVGINLNVLNPGEPMSMYHRENNQEGFLVLAGECLLIVEGEERRLKTWDFFHCPGKTAHVIIGAGDGPAFVLAVGARGGRKSVVYLVAETALKHRAGVEEETTKSADAYARFPPSTRSPYRDGWLPTFWPSHAELERSDPSNNCDQPRFYDRNQWFPRPRSNRPSTDFCWPGRAGSS